MKQFDPEREKKLFVPKGEERNDEMRGKKRNKNHKAQRKTLKTEISTGRRYSAICAEERMSE